MCKVYILCGKIASGKTTYAEVLREQERAVILSVDDVMLNLYDACLGQTKHQEAMQRITSYFFTLIPQLMRTGCSVVLDYGYWTKQERDWIKLQCRQANVPYEMHYIEAEEEVRLQRLVKRNRKNEGSKDRQYIIQDDLQITLDSRFEVPDKNEYDKHITG